MLLAHIQPMALLRRARALPHYEIVMTPARWIITEDPELQPIKRSAPRGPDSDHLLAAGIAPDIPVT